MNKRCLFWGLFMFAMNAGAQPRACDTVDAQMEEMVTTDQQIREESMLLDQKPDAPAAEKADLRQRWSTIDRDNLKQFKEIVGRCGWPTTRKYTHMAWLLAQHADSDPAFQRVARGLIEASVRKGIAAPRDLAYIADRIAANERRPQEYGTQFSQPDRCHLVLDPVDDRELVNRRRLAIGLTSLEAYEAEGRRRFIPADCSTAASERQHVEADGNNR